MRLIKHAFRWLPAKTPRVLVQSPSVWPATKPTAPHLKTRADPLELQREAKELLELSQSLQPDMESVNHGILPKDTIEKLKRIEKLSKRLRGELGQ
jgi:hypothetical protein